jgi:hypothetical protein
MAGMGQTQSFGDVDSMCGLPKSEHDWAIFYEYTPERDAARRSRALGPGRLHCTACTPPALAREEQNKDNLPQRCIQLVSSLIHASARLRN